MKYLILIVVMFLIGCNHGPLAIADYQDLDAMILKRLEGEFKESIAYDLRNGDVCNEGHIYGFTCISFNTNLTIVCSSKFRV